MSDKMMTYNNKDMLYLGYEYTHKVNKKIKTALHQIDRICNF